ncbi:hypothetical protein H6F43_06630 [Leptolyngbya sp. FACHB-36]|uniref:hypothetical protein n=1 Tax=Leptolyngbya sp. FACHB-36 TaxID=2692808 RepID=UPI001680B772|nr:hypothetical protein [Leptolyngbya sp. FACHB-36]MBD2019863.1 hypothetical protein [Leptolyngbya sp. FACHB-36]
MLLLVAYASFGWFLSDPQFSRFSFVIAIGWIWIIAEAFMDPLTGFSLFLSRWFKSDTVAFLAICMVAGLAAVMLFWLHVFLHILTILATEALARLELQTAKFTRRQTFWMLTSVSLVGLVLGWAMREYVPIVMNLLVPAPVAEPKELSLLGLSVT